MIIATSQPNNVLMNQCEKSQGQAQACCAGGALLCVDIKQESGCLTGWFVAYLVAAKHIQVFCYDTWKHYLYYFMLCTVALKKAMQASEEQKKSPK